MILCLHIDLAVGIFVSQSLRMITNAKFLTILGHAYMQLFGDVEQNVICLFIGNINVIDSSKCAKSKATFISSHLLCRVFMAC